MSQFMLLFRNEGDPFQNQSEEEKKQQDYEGGFSRKCEEETRDEMETKFGTIGRCVDGIGCMLLTL